jgi:hypothetical protein
LNTLHFAESVFDEITRVRSDVYFVVSDGNESFPALRALEWLFRAAARGMVMYVTPARKTSFTKITAETSYEQIENCD